MLSMRYQGIGMRYLNQGPESDVYGTAQVLGAGETTHAQGYMDREIPTEQKRSWGCGHGLS